MPSKSKAQHRLMEAVANSPSLAERLGVKQDVAKEFVDVDKGTKVGKLPEKKRKK